MRLKAKEGLLHVFDELWVVALLAAPPAYHIKALFLLHPPPKAALPHARAQIAPQANPPQLASSSQAET